MWFEPYHVFGRLGMVPCLPPERDLRSCFRETCGKRDQFFSACFHGTGPNALTHLDSLLVFLSRYSTSQYLHAALVEICRRCWHWARLSSCYQDSHWHWMPRLGPTIRWFKRSSHSRPQQATVWKGFSSVICVAFRLNSHEAFSSFSFRISQGLRPTLGFLCRSTNCRMGSEHLELLELSVFSAR